MSPRKYDMSRRAAAAEATRQRIVDATFDVHAEQGIAGARLEDIARRAGVSLGTVYRHFPRYDDLVAACGRMTFERMPPPRAGAASSALAGIDDARGRLEVLVDALFGFYEQTGPMIEVMRRDRAALPVLDDALEQLESDLAAWVEEAVRPLPDVDRALVAALVDHRTWTALVEHGVADPRAAALRLMGSAAA